MVARCFYAHCGLLVMFDSLGLDIVARQDHQTSLLTLGTYRVASKASANNLRATYQFQQCGKESDGVDELPVPD